MLLVLCISKLIVVQLQPFFHSLKKCELCEHLLVSANLWIISGFMVLMLCVDSGLHTR